MSNDRIFILGAGASKFSTSNLEDIQMPLARDFFKSKFVNQLWPCNYIKGLSFNESALLKIISQYFSASFKKYKQGKYYLTNIDTNVNIEEVFSFIEFINQGYHDIYDEEILIQHARKQLFEYLLHSLNSFTSKKFNYSLYNKIIDSLEDGDSILTYNWDLLIDVCLLKKRKGKKLLDSLTQIINPISLFSTKDYDSISYENLHKSYYLKLHGSINWACCSNLNCLRNSIPLIFGIEEEPFITGWDCDYCGGKLELMILPPHIHKTYQKSRFYSLQAKLAFNKLSTAREIVVIGYSFPDFDFEANSIFRKSRMSYETSKSSQLFLERVVVVNPETESVDYVDKVKNLFGLNLSRRYYGHKVDLELYSSIEQFLRDFNFKRNNNDNMMNPLLKKLSSLQKKNID